MARSLVRVSELNQYRFAERSAEELQCQRQPLLIQAGC